MSDDWPLAPDPNPPEPGKYVIAFLRGRFVNRFCRPNIELDFSIVQPEQSAGKVVTKYYALPVTGPIGQESNYYKDWKRANGDVAPNRNDRMSPKVFQGYWHAELGRTKQKTDRSVKEGIRKLKDNEQGRVIVTNLLERAAGAARPQRR